MDFAHATVFLSPQPALTPVLAYETLSAAPAARPAGFGLGIAVLTILVAALLYALAAAGLAGMRRRLLWAPAWAAWAMPGLALAGLGIALYLTYVETRQVVAICGPVGDCNAVQSSPYARLFGVLPVGVVGAVGYVAIIVAWGVRRYGRGMLTALAPLVLFAMALFGVLFSAYLTYLELFIILAICIWCLSSAVNYGCAAGPFSGPSP